MSRAPARDEFTPSEHAIIEFLAEHSPEHSWINDLLRMPRGLSVRRKSAIFGFGALLAVTAVVVPSPLAYLWARNPNPTLDAIGDKGRDQDMCGALRFIAVSGAPEPLHQQAIQNVGDQSLGLVDSCHALTVSL